MNATQAQQKYDQNEAILPEFRSLTPGTRAWVYSKGEFFLAERISTEARWGRGGSMNLSKNGRRVDGRNGKVFVMGLALVEGREMVTAEADYTDTIASFMDGTR